MRKLSRISILIGTLLLFARADAQTDSKVLLELVKKNANKMWIPAADISTLSISNFHKDEKSGIVYVYLQQRYNGIKVHNSIISAAFRNNQLLYSSGKFVDSIAAKTRHTAPSLAPRQAVERAAQELGLNAPAGLQQLEDRYSAEKKLIFSPAGIARQNIETELFYITTDEGRTVKLAWNVNIDELRSSDWWNVFIDATSGQYLTRFNWTVHEKHDDHGHLKKGAASPAAPPPGVAGKTWSPSPPNVTDGSYMVVPFPFESPSHGAPAVVNNPWLKAGAGNNATTHGWHFDGTANYEITRGNNVFAFLDVTASNTPNAASNWPDTSTTPAPVLTFVNAPDFGLSPRTTINKKFALDNLFYWNNLMHDVYYQYGFTEAAGNFQRDNLGRGGLGGDWVNAQAQDGAGMDNANFATPPDGSNGRMRMYLFNGFAFVNATAPASVAGVYNGLEGAFSTANLLKDVGPKTGEVVWFNDPAGTHFACVAGTTPTNSLTGKIALITRGGTGNPDGTGCEFVVKAKNAQAAGAIAIIVINNVAGNLTVMGGTDNSITIPAVMISQSDGAILAAQAGNGLTVTLSDGGRDGDLDNGIVCHEYGHGISNRLTGGPANSNCLGHAEQGGEGWSDYFSLMMTTDWSTATLTSGATPRPIGTYASSEPTNGAGIRRFPYSTDMSVNGLTYANMAASTQVHNIGEIWCSALWDMTWNIIQQTSSITTDLYNSNGTGGNVIALNLVTMGLKLQPCNPGFLDARDAILAADSILYNNAHKCAIWSAFARRGMGVNAVQGSAFSATDQTAGFNVPTGLGLTRGEPIVTTTGTNFSISTSATCGCEALTGYVIRDTIPAGFTVVNSSPAGTLNGNVYSFNASNFAIQEAKTFTLTLEATAAGCDIDSVIYDNRESHTTGGLASSTTGTGGGWISSTDQSHSGSSAWKSLEPSTVSTSSLISQQFANAAGQNLSILSFWHYFDTEKTYDGGVVEYTTDGVNWIDASPFFILNGYNAAMDASTVLAGRKAFTGTNRDFTLSVLDFSSLGTTPYRVRFRMTTDDGTSGNGWYVDDIIRANGCGGILKTGAYNASNQPVDAVTIPVFVKAVPSTITIDDQPESLAVCVGNSANFTVAATSATALGYQWQVSTNGGANFTNIPGETAATLSLTGATLSMNGYQYRCVVNDADNSVTTSAVTLTVSGLPAISNQPVNKTVCVGGSITFNVTATAASGYQWQVSTDGGNLFNNIAGETASSLSLSSTLAQNGNQYRCIVTNDCGDITSAAVTLAVIDASITTNPVNTSKCAGADADFTVSTTGTGLTYQWQVSTDGGNNFNNIPAANAATLNLAAVTPGMNNNRYRCVVTASCGTLTTTAATLTVNSANLVLNSLPARICISDDAIALAGTPAGGTWTGDGVSGSTFIPGVAGIGQHTLTYTYSSGPGCVNTATTTANVEDCVDRNITLANGGVILFPNPNNGEFWLRMNSLLYNRIGIRVFNSLGQLVHAQEFSNLTFGSLIPVNLKHAAAGLYRVQVYTGTISGMEEKIFPLMILK